MCLVIVIFLYFQVISFTFMKTCVHTHLRIITFFWEICIVHIRAYKKQDKQMMTLCFNFFKHVYSAVRTSRTRIVISVGRKAAGEHPYWPAREMSPQSRLNQLLSTNLGRVHPAVLNHFSPITQHSSLLPVTRGSHRDQSDAHHKICVHVRTHTHTSTLLLLREGARKVLAGFIGKITL